MKALAALLLLSGCTGLSYGPVTTETAIGLRLHYSLGPAAVMRETGWRGPESDTTDD